MTDTHNIFAWWFTWSDPPPKKPRNLLLCMGSQWVIIMARSYHQIKPIHMRPWMLNLEHVIKEKLIESDATLKLYYHVRHFITTMLQSEPNKNLNRRKTIINLKDEHLKKLSHTPKK